MPQLDPRALKTLLESKRCYPVIWFHGPESLKARELLKLLRTQVRAITQNPLWSEETLEAQLLTGGELADRALSPLLGGSTSIVVVRDADLIKHLEDLAPAFGPAAPLEELAAVVVLFGKAPDARKKFTKLLIEKAAVVECSAVPDYERESWVDYLAKRRGTPLHSDLRTRLISVEPWSLDAIEQELEKIALQQTDSAASEEWTRASGFTFDTDAFIRGFFERSHPPLAAAEHLARSSDDALPLLGLLAWHVRQLLLLGADPQGVKLSPSIRDRLERYRRNWTPTELSDLLEELVEADFGLKQSGAPALGIWARIVRHA